MEPRRPRTRLDPGREAGRASVRRYRAALRFAAPQIATALLALGVAIIIWRIAMLLAGDGRSAADLLDDLFGVTALEALAIVVAAGLALHVGVPMGMYVHGLLAGYDPLYGDAGEDR